MQHNPAKTPLNVNEGSEYYLPDVTVIVPAYNSAATIGLCIDSLLDQDYPSERYEIIVVDNNSSDNTSFIVQKYPVRLAFEKGVQSPGAARNRGIALAKTELVAFLDSDCVAEQGWLHKLVQPFRNTTVGVVGCKILAQTPPSNLVEAFLVQIRINERNFSSSEPKGFLSGAVIYRRSALDQVGAFDIFMQGNEDVDLAWRVQAYGGYQGVYVPEAVVYNRHRSTLVGLFRQFKKYGFFEIVLTTRYRDEPFHKRTPTFQLHIMGRQFLALGTYILSFGIRLLRWRRWRLDRLYLASPVLWFVLESGNLIGKLEALIATRGFRFVPLPTGPET